MRPLRTVIVGLTLAALGACAAAGGRKGSPPQEPKAIEPGVPEVVTGKSWVHWHVVNVDYSRVRQDNIPMGYPGAKILSAVPVYECPCETSALGHVVEPRLAGQENLGGLEVMRAPQVIVRVMDGYALVWLRDGASGKRYYIQVESDTMEIIGDTKFDLRPGETKRLRTNGGEGTAWGQILREDDDCQPAADGPAARADMIPSEGGGW